MNEEEMYRKNLENIRKILRDRNEMVKIFSVSQIKEMEEIVRNIEIQMNALIENFEIKSKEEDIRKIENVVNLLLNIAIYKPIRPAFKEVVDELTLLLYNWNKQIYKNKKMEDNIIAIKRIVDLHTTVNESITVIKKLMQKAEKVSKYTPEAFQLSRHYLKTLKEELDEQTRT